MKALVVIDMQNDFIDGALGTPEARAIVPRIVEKMEAYDGHVYLTQDGHLKSEYKHTIEGKRLPQFHCILDTEGHKLHKHIWLGLNDIVAAIINKDTFACLNLKDFLNDIGIDEIELCGLCTDICVISNALYLRSAFPTKKITVDASCCAGTTPEAHKIAIQAMKNCMIDIINEGE